MTTTPDPSPASSERLRIVVPNVTLHTTNELWEFAQALLALAQDLDRAADGVQMPPIISALDEATKRNKTNNK